MREKEKWTGGGGGGVGESGYKVGRMTRRW